MTATELVVFSINQNSLKKIANYLHCDYQDRGQWSSPEHLFRGFLQKLIEELEDPNGAIAKDEEFVDGESRFSVDCGDALAARVHEILDADDELQQLITTNPSRDELSAYLSSKNFSNLFHDGLEHVRDGKTTIEEISRVINI